MQWIYGYVQIHMARHINSQTYKCHHHHQCFHPVPCSRERCIHTQRWISSMPINKVDFLNTWSWRLTGYSNCAPPHHTHKMEILWWRYHCWYLAREPLRATAPPQSQSHKLPGTQTSPITHTADPQHSLLAKPLWSPHLWPILHSSQHKSRAIPRCSSPLSQGETHTPVDCHQPSPVKLWRAAPITHWWLSKESPGSGSFLWVHYWCNNNTLILYSFVGGHETSHNLRTWIRVWTDDKYLGPLLLSLPEDTRHIQIHCNWDSQTWGKSGNLSQVYIVPNFAKN